ncbi:minor capsid protein [Helicobacter rodentium]|uniref:minor capsid protein n=3 Tax=Helicobacter rodentium TaxID=59617 RepID=UPI0026E955AA|nr:minor capsid protein [Helicobacter rodentium]
MKHKNYKSLNIARASKAKEEEFFKRLRALSNTIDLSMQYWLLLAAKRKYTAKQLNKQIERLSNYWDKKAKEKAEPIAKAFAKGINGFLNVKLRKQAEGISLKEKTRLLQNEFNAAIERNTALIKSIPREIIERYRSEILNNVSNLNQEALIKAFKSFSNISKNRVRFIARDQTQKAITALQNAKAQQLGYNYYIWHTAKDSRVSDEHKRLEGRIYSYANPTAIIDSYGNVGHCSQRPNCRSYPEPIMLNPNQELELVKDSRAGDYYKIKARK